MKSAFISLLIFIFPLAGPDEFEYIKIFNLSKKPIVEVRLNDKKAYFLLDTGSNITVLNIFDTKKYKFRLRRLRKEKNAALGVGSWPFF